MSEDWQERYNAFWKRLQTTAKNDNGFRAILKRNAGLPIGCTNKAVDGRAIMAFYKVYGGGLFSIENEDKGFFAACAACSWDPKDWERGISISSTQRFFNEAEKESFERHLQRLMDLPWDRDGYFAGKLYKLLKFCKQKNIIINCKDLLRDLLLWEREDRLVQRKWVREFYRT